MLPVNVTSRFPRKNLGQCLNKKWDQPAAQNLRAMVISKASYIAIAVKHWFNVFQVIESMKTRREVPKFIESLKPFLQPGMEHMTDKDQLAESCKNYLLNFYP